MELDHSAIEVDAAAFERHVADGAAESLDRAVMLYGGDLLDGFTVSALPFDEWLVRERERLHAMAVDAHAGLLAQRIAQGEHARALQVGTRQINLDPYHERAHRALMRLHVAHGRRGAALRHCQMCVDTLQRDLGVKPENPYQRARREIGVRPGRMF